MRSTEDAALKVAVTEASIRRLGRIVSALEPDYLQVHGASTSDPDLEEIEGLLRKVDLIWAVSMSDPEAPRKAEALAGLFHGILLDTGKGGTGEIHDWRLSREIRDKIHPTRVYLAGGLTPGNVREAIRIVKPYCVDASSSLEERPGIKDPMKVKAFISKAKGS